MAPLTRKVIWITIVAVILITFIASKIRAYTGTGHTTVATVAAFRNDVICENVGNDFDFSNAHVDRFKVTLREGCFSDWIHVPSSWQYWKVTAVGDSTDYWIAYWFPNDASGIGPYRSNAVYTINKNTQEPFRLQGRGTYAFYTNQPTPQTAENHGNSADADAFQGAPPKVKIVTINASDPHFCMKPDDAYFAQWGAAVPMPAGTGEFKNPEYLFDSKHMDNKVTWANNFSGKVIICLLVDENGLPTDFTFPASPPRDLQENITNLFSGNHYKAGWYYENYRDRTPHIVKTQIAYELIFPE